MTTIMYCLDCRLPNTPGGFRNSFKFQNSEDWANQCRAWSGATEQKYRDESLLRGFSGLE